MLLSNQVTLPAEDVWMDLIKVDDELCADGGSALTTGLMESRVVFMNIRH